MKHSWHLIMQDTTIGEETALQLSCHIEKGPRYAPSCSATRLNACLVLTFFLQLPSLFVITARLMFAPDVGYMMSGIKHVRPWLLRIFVVLSFLFALLERMYLIRSWLLCIVVFCCR